MKKVLFAIALLMGCTFHSYAQEVKRIDASLQDYVQLLEAEGYKVYPFDISYLKGSKYTLRFEVKEYAGGQEKEIAPLMTASILKDSPHYYVIGFRVIETNF